MALDENKPMDRRKFFRMGLGELLRPFAAAAKPLERVAHEIGKLEQLGQAQAKRANVPLELWLRPPGALIEREFLSTCSQCGKCAEVCPVHAIQIDTSGKRGHGAPYIDPEVSACAVCEGLQCMNHCPSGALVPTSINDIEMGTAVWKEQFCLRTSGQDCKICVDHCPLGSAAIELKEGRIAVNPRGCIGCGVCQQDCPTSPRSIRVIPDAAKLAGR